MCYRATRLITKWHSLTPGGIDDLVLREDHLYIMDSSIRLRVATGVLPIVSQKLEQER
jgi:hypothetical protein